MGEYPHCGSCQQNNKTFSGHTECVCMHIHMHSSDLPERVYLCSDLCKACLHRHVVVSLCCLPLYYGCLYAGAYPSVFRCTHQCMSVCICICLCVSESLPASSQIQLGPSYLQSFLSCFRSLQARIVQSFLQSFPYHRYKSKGDIDPAFQRYPSKISRKDGGLGKQEQCDSS